MIRIKYNYYKLQIKKVEKEIKNNITMNNKLPLYTGALLLIAIVAAVWVQVANNSTPAVNNNAPAGEQNLSSMPAATGNIDDAAKAFTAESNGEAALLNQQAAGAGIVAQTPKEVIDLSQTYDEKQIK